MELRNINFNTLETVKKHCILFAKDGNTVVKPYKPLYRIEDITGNVEHNNLFLEVVKGKETWEEDSYRLYDDLEKICALVDWIPGYWTLEEFTKRMKKWEYFGKNGLFKRLKVSEENGYYINKIDIELCVVFEKLKLAKHYTEYRESYIKTREEKAQAKRKEHECKEREEEEIHQRGINKQIAEAENAIRAHKELYNQPLENTTIILYLIKKYGIKIPLKTQGWVNKALAKVWFNENGEITYSYYTSSKNSKVFMHYLKELEEKINATK